ncbi:hypothetical protein, partial [Microvirga aerilata]|uniref:hypothetical protein n=1 Tax=Microvirga aerilata TaxID=670292 RepID=UPI00360D03E1
TPHSPRAQKRRGLCRIRTGPAKTAQRQDNQNLKERQLKKRVTAQAFPVWEVQRQYLYQTAKRM